MIGISLMPESPRWLSSKGQMQMANEILKKIYVKEEVEKRFNELEEEADSVKS